MSRELKFRGIRVDNEEIVYGYPCPMYQNGYIGKCDRMCIKSGVLSVFEIIPDTLGQFTGLKDKNGQDIYEGDKYLLRVPERLTQTHTGDNIPLGSYTEPLEPIIKEFRGQIMFLDGCFGTVDEGDINEDGTIVSMEYFTPLCYSSIKFGLQEVKHLFSQWDDYDNPRHGWKWDDEEEGDLQYLLEEYNLNSQQELLDYLGLEIIGNIHQNKSLLKSNN